MTKARSKHARDCLQVRVRFTKPNRVTTVLRSSASSGPALSMDAWRQLPDSIAVVLSLLVGGLVGWLLGRGVQHWVRSSGRRRFARRATRGLSFPVGLLGFMATSAWLLSAADVPLLEGRIPAWAVGAFAIVWVALIGIDLLWVTLGRERSREHPAWTAVLLLLRRAGKVVVVAVGVVFVLGKLGVPIGGLAVATGAVGAAVAFAARGPVQDLFAFISLVLDPPFLVGDRVRIVHVRGGPETLGKVQRIGLQSTVIQAKGRSLVSFPNAMLASEMRLENLTARARRRMRWSLSLPSDLTNAELERVGSAVEAALESLPTRDVRRPAQAWLSGSSGVPRLELEVWLKVGDEAARRAAEDAATLRVLATLQHARMSRASDTAPAGRKRDDAADLSH